MLSNAYCSTRIERISNLSASIECALSLLLSCSERRVILSSTSVISAAEASDFSLIIVLSAGLSLTLSERSAYARSVLLICSETTFSLSSTAVISPPLAAASFLLICSETAFSLSSTAVRSTSAGTTLSTAPTVFTAASLPLSSEYISSLRLFCSAISASLSVMRVYASSLLRVCSATSFILSANPLIASSRVLACSESSFIFSASPA